MEYLSTIDGVASDKLEGFFEGWKTHPDREGLLLILQNSSEKIIAMENGKVVGFITAITDKTLSAYIPLLEVLPEFRKKGVGSELVKRMLGRLSGYYIIDVVCDEGLVSFYEQFGMKKGTAMTLRNYQNQAGKQ